MGSRLLHPIHGRRVPHHSNISSNLKGSMCCMVAAEGSRPLHPIFICQQFVTDGITILLQFDDI
jgi:hypothetical protein